MAVAPGRTEFTWRGRRVVLALTGSVNVDNALLAAEAAVCLGVDPDVVVTGLAATRPVPGRMEVVAAPSPSGPPFTVLVDYAHTPDGLEVALGESRRLAGPDSRVLVAFGCGGSRDRTKRPLMGAVATNLADLVVVTSDNPRDEEPGAIIDEIVAGAVPSDADALAAGRLVVEPDRRRAVDPCDRGGRSRRRGADRRQGPRDLPGDRRPSGRLRRPLGGRRSPRPFVVR